MCSAPAGGRPVSEPPVPPPGQAPLPADAPRPEQAPLSQAQAPVASAPDDVLRVEHIAKRFGPVTALRDVSLHLRKGEVLGLLGDNGAGKSTLIKTICGFQKQDSGRMFLHGQPYQPKRVDDDRG